MEKLQAAEIDLDIVLQRIWLKQSGK